MAYTLQGPIAQEETWVLRGVDLTLPNDRAKSRSAYHSIRAGLRFEGNTEWVGSWSQADGGLSNGVTRSILDSGSLNRRLRKGQIGVVEITKVGSPATLVGGSVVFHLERVGSRSGKPQPFISTTSSDSPDLRALADQINESGLTKFSHAVQLVDETPAEAEAVTHPYVLLSSASASASSSVDFDTAAWFDGTYKHLILRGYEIISATDNVDLVLRVSSGSAYKTTTYSWGRGYAYAGGNGHAGSGSDSWIELANAVGNASSTDGAWFTAEVYKPSSTAIYKGVNYLSGTSDISGNLTSLHGAGRWEGGTGALDGLRVLMSSGNITSGEFELYGVRA